MPSPTIATVRPSACSRLTSSTLPSGSTPATTRSIPASAAMARAVRSLSPVSITTSIPSSRRRRTAAAEVSRMGSATATAPAGWPSTATWMMVRASGTVIVSRGVTSLSLPAATLWPSTTPVTPLPVTASKSFASESSSPRDRASSIMAEASGCSDPRSSEASTRSSSSSFQPRAGTISVTAGEPTVTVPVLSSTTVSTLPARSSASPPLISTPSSAPRPVDTITAVGTASPMAQGQAMISTATAAAKPRTTGAASAATYQTAKVAMAMDMTTGTKMALIRSASLWIGARVPWASRIRRTIRARVLA